MRRTSARAASSAGIEASGVAVRKACLAFFSSLTSLVLPGTRDQSVVTPSSGLSFIGSPASGWNASGVGPRRRAAPKPWLLWLLRLSAASSG